MSGRPSGHYLRGFRRGVLIRDEILMALKVIQVKDTIQVIYFMFQRLGKEIFGSKTNQLRLTVDPLGLNPDGASNNGVVTRYAQAPFLNVAFALSVRDLGVHVNPWLVFIREMDHYDASKYADLVGGQANPASFIQRVDQVVGKRQDRLVDLAHLLCLLPERDVRIL